MQYNYLIEIGLSSNQAGASPGSFLVAGNPKSRGDANTSCQRAVRSQTPSLRTAQPRAGAAGVLAAFLLVLSNPRLLAGDGKHRGKGRANSPEVVKVVKPQDCRVRVIR